MAAADLYILGTNHPLQCGSISCAQLRVQAFETEVRSLCKKYKIQRVAEEMTKEGLKKHKVTATVGQRVAKDIGAEYQMVDLRQTERRNLSIDDSPVISTVMRYHIAQGGGFREAFDDLADGVRERVWIGRILSGAKWPTLFVCGSNHVISVRRLWRCLGLASKVVHLDYEP